jgi:hypothetical protein
MMDYALETTVYIQFTTRAFATGVPTQLAGTPAISVLEENNATPITAGITLNVDRASVTGLNEVAIAATAANGYEAGKEYAAYVSVGTVGGTSVVGEVVGRFSIQKSSALRPTTAGRTLDVSAGGEAGVDWANVGSPTTTVGLSGTTIATTQKVDVETIKTNPVANGGTVTFPTNSTLASTANITGGTITTVTNLTNAPTSGDLTATMKTSVQTAATASLNAYDPPTRTEATADTDSILAEIATVDGIVDSIVADTNELQTDWADGGRLDLILDARASQTSVDTIDDFLDTEIAAILAAVDTEVAAILADPNELQTDWANGGRLDLIIDAILADTVEIGTAGAGLSAIPWNASWDAEVQSEVTDGLNAYDPPTRTELTSDTDSILAAVATVDGNVDDIETLLNAVALDVADILADTGTDGVVVAAASKTGYALSSAGIDSIWDEVMEGSFTARQYMRGFAAAMLAILSGAATTTVVIRDTGDTKDRVTATVDANGNRSAVTLDLT